MLIYYVILCSVLCYSSPLGYRLSLFRCEKRLRTSTTLPHFSRKKMNIVIVRSNDELKLPIHRFVAFQIYTLYNIFAVLGKSCGEMPKPQAKQWMMIFLFDYKLCDQNDKPNIFTLFASQQLVLHSACALRFSGFAQTYGLNRQWKHKWCFVILMLINNSQR